MGKDCTTSSLYESLGFCKGRTVLPGIRSRVFYIQKSSIVKWPALIDTAKAGASMGALATYEGNFELAADKKWLSIDVLTTASQINAESQGEAPSKTFLNKTSLKHAGIEEDATGFARQANADDLVYLCQQRNGKFRVVGNDMYETETKPSQASGTDKDGAGTTLEIEVTDICPAPFYPSKIETEDGDISGLDGSAWTEPQP